MTISRISRVCGGVNKFAWGDPCDDSYDMYLINVYIITWIEYLLRNDGMVFVTKYVLGVPSSIIERD